jgi:hypothetical protein
MCLHLVSPVPSGRSTFTFLCCITLLLHTPCSKLPGNSDLQPFCLQLLQQFPDKHLYANVRPAHWPVLALMGKVTRYPVCPLTPAMAPAATQQLFLVYAPDLVSLAASATLVDPRAAALLSPAGSASSSLQPWPLLPCNYLPSSICSGSIVSGAFSNIGKFLGQTSAGLALMSSAAICIKVKMAVHQVSTHIPMNL